MVYGFDIKIIFGVLAAILAIWAHIPYLLATIKGTNRPHVFTWILWTLLTGIAGAAQFMGDAGPGAWTTLVTFILCIFIMGFAIKLGEKVITRADWVMFLAGLSAIPAWILTDNPFFAILIVSVIDGLAFGPTFRKAWHEPQFENSFMYGLNIIRHCIALAALAQFNWVTALYPATMLTMNIAMYTMLKIRRLSAKIAI